MPRINATTFSILLAPFCAAILGAAPATLVNDSIIDPLAHNFPTVSFSVPTVHGVTFQQDGLTTYKGWQYAAYYQGNGSNSTGKVAVGRRKLPAGAWQTLVLGDYTFSNVDSHNDVVLGICAVDGTIHLSFDHHGHPLKYRASVPGLANDPENTAWNSSLFGPVEDHLLSGGATMTAVTYPRFIPTPSGKLLFTYRFGGSGGGDEILYEYDGLPSSWSLVGQYTSRSGSYTGTFASGTDRNSYFDNTVFDANGRLHATWCWRETPDASSNHDLLYAYSDDVGRTWKNQLGNQIAVSGTSYININSPGIIGWAIPQKRNYINNSAMTVDADGRVHVVSWQLPSALPDQTPFSTSLSSNARYIHYWRGTDGTWRRNETNITGTRAKLVADSDGRLFLAYGNATNIQIASANPASNPEANPALSWNDWSAMDLSGALPAGKANTVNIIHDTARWEKDRILSIYAQETNISGTGPTPLHVLDYHVSKAAVLPQPLDASTITGTSPLLSWTGGQGAVEHDVYLGTTLSAVAAATPSSPEYVGRQAGTSLPRGPLLQETTYYWRIDSVDAGSIITEGSVWSFQTGSLKPIITHGASTRGPGTSATFRASLVLPDPSATDVTFYWGESDGGEIIGNWQNVVPLGVQAAGDVETTLPATSSNLIHYRFHASNVHGSSWAPSSGTLASLAPSIVMNSATRTYGGRAIFNVTLDFKDPLTQLGEVTLFHGPSDGGTTPGSWQDATPCGNLTSGSQQITLDAIPATAFHFRFRVTTVHGTAWSDGLSPLAAAEDLSGWQNTALMEVTGYSGTETLVDFPVLVRLSSTTVPGFSYAGMLSPPFGDLRFSTEQGDQLSYQVENWDPLGTSSIWVKLPVLTNGTKFRIWWGMPGKSAPSSSGTWSSFNGVWHLDSALGFTADSSSNNLSATATALASASSAVIPGAIALNGTTSTLAIDNAAALNPSSISVEAWVKTTSSGTAAIFNKDQSAGGTNRVWQFRLNAGKPEFIPFSATSNATASSPDAINDDAYHHVCGTWDGANIRIYVDGVLKGTTALSGTLRTGQTNKAFIGRGENASPLYFPGSIDEVRLSPVARSLDWIRSSWENQRPNAAFLIASPVEQPDLDGDHLPDAWEVTWHGSIYEVEDPDQDGLPDLLEFALGTDPSSGSDMPYITYLPAASPSQGEFIYPQIAGGAGDVGINYAVAGLIYRAEVSIDLMEWHSGPAVIAWSNRRESLPNGMERVGIRVIDPVLNASPQIYCRLRVVAGN